MIRGFEDLDVWQEAMKLAASVYAVLRECRDFGLRDQMQRAAVSIASNIAEGFERRSNREFMQFLYVAQGSCAEMRTQLYLSMEIKLIPEQQCHSLIEQTRKISAMLYKLIQTRKTKFT